jgi:hypothetical protein
MQRPTLGPILSAAEALYHDLELATVRCWRWRRRGARAVGCVGEDPPRALIEAAGMLPVALAGPLPRDALDVLDALVLGPGTDEAAWQALVPGKPVLRVDGRGRRRARQVAALRAVLEQLARRAVGEGELRRARARQRARTRALASLARLRREAPERVPAWEQHLVRLAGALLPADEHTRMIDDYVYAASAAGARAAGPAPVARLVAQDAGRPSRALSIAITSAITSDMIAGGAKK